MSIYCCSSNGHRVGISPTQRKTKSYILLYLGHIGAGEGPLGWDMISMNGAFKCCLLKLPQGPRNHKMPVDCSLWLSVIS